MKLFFSRFLLLFFFPSRSFCKFFQFSSVPSAPGAYPPENSTPTSWTLTTDDEFVAASTRGWAVVERTFPYLPYCHCIGSVDIRFVSGREKHTIMCKNWIIDFFLPKENKKLPFDAALRHVCALSCKTEDSDRMLFIGYKIYIGDIHNRSIIFDWLWFASSHLFTFREKIDIVKWHSGETSSTNTTKKTQSWAAKDWIKFDSM